MQNAGYEVLLNKKNWRNPSSERRDLWRPTTGSTGTGSNLFITRGASAALTFEPLDGYESYPLVLAGPVDEVLPRAAWLMGGTDDGCLKVKGAWDPEQVEVNSTA
jgi:hypothetical protein